MASNPRTVKFIARHLLNEVPRTREIDRRSLILFSRDFYDFCDHPLMNGRAIRMAASQMLSVRTGHERPM